MHMPKLQTYYLYVYKYTYEQKRNDENNSEC